MVYQVGYWSQLESFKFDEGDGDTMVSTFMAMPYGEYEHPVYGKINFDQTVATEAAQNVNTKVRGTDLDIDYDHKQYGGEAAGWVKSAEARSNGLYLTVEWTKKAAGLIRDKAYRYFSPEFSDEWTHPKTKVKHKNVLFGGGITNRPFLKDILPLNMSELFEEQANQQNQEGTGMDPKKLRKLLGLPEDATDEQVTAAFDALPPDSVIGQQADNEEEHGDDNEDGAQGADKGKLAANEGLPPEVIRLTESANPEVKALAEMVVGLTKQVATTSTALQLAETANLVQKLSEPVNNRAIPAGAQKLLSDALLNPSQKNVVALVEALNKTGYVQLGEQGSGNEHSEHDGEAATKQFNDKVAALVKDEKIGYADAVERVALSDPDLFEGHRQASYAFKSN